MKITKYILLIGLFTTVACAKRAANPNVSSQTDVDTVSDFDEDNEFIVEEDSSQPKTTNEEIGSVSSNDDLIAPTDSVASVDTSTDMQLNDSDIFEHKEVSVTTDVLEYDVQHGDTLMWVAFKIYGDYGKWKSLRELNPGVTGNRLVQGTKLKYYVPAERFDWNPQGEPYLIHHGDTLGTISKDKYGTDKRWKDIYNNNKPMIKDPHLIFAGFTLYYIPDQRDVASEI